jgi:hypothetical protein
VPLVHYLQNHGGCQVEVVSFGRSTSLKLKEATDDFLDLDLDPKRYLMNYRAVRGRNFRSRPGQENDADDSKASLEDVNRITGVE